jgi:fructose PTS system EIIBC or EIIC component
MKITELLSKDTILLHMDGSQKEEAINQLVDVLYKADKIADRSAFKAEIIKREQLSTTGIGDGIAIPHAKTKAVKKAAIAFGKSVSGINYEALDNKPSHLFFMIAAPEGANNTHLDALARLSGMLMKAEVRYQLLTATTAEEIIEIINQYDKEEVQETTSVGKKNFIVAVTGCPTGIAHTYMAADSLKAKAAEMGVDIKVETNGSGGAKNVLTKNEIENAVAVIIAADINVEMERFKGKHVIQAAVADGIRKSEQLINRALKQDAPIYNGNGSSGKTQGNDSRRGFYKHLMNGVSNMLPFVVGGGILIALCFMFGYKSFDPKDPSYNPIAATLMTIGGGTAFKLLVPVLAGFIALSIADRPGFAPGMVGGMMAANAGAGFLGGLIAGFLAGYIVVMLKKLFANMPKSLEGIKSILIYPLLGIMLTGFIMNYVVDNPVAWLNTEISTLLKGLGSTNAIFLGILLGLMMAFDMGGPVNKAAYVFGTGLLASGVYGPMAAIMAAGMVPPLALAIATTIFKNKFNHEDRDAGKACYVMGLSFITEGAIPFAAADPFRVIPANMIGAAITGALTMAFGIGLRAPHGGIFVVPLVQGGALKYALAILIGSVISALLIGFLKKTVEVEQKQGTEHAA